MRNRPVLLIGSTYATELRDVEQAIRRTLAGCDLRAANSIQSAIASIQQGDFFPDLVVVCQTWPDEFTRVEVEALIAECALARMVVAYGPWCDSDGRNRQIWPLAARVPVNLIEGRLQRESDVLSGRSQPLPLTANRDEIFEFDRGRDQLNAEANQRRQAEVCVDIVDSGLRCSIVAQLKDEGIRVSESARLKIYDADVSERETGLGISGMPECHDQPTVSKLAPVDTLADAVHRS